MKSLKN